MAGRLELARVPPILVLVYRYQVSAIGILWYYSSDHMSLTEYMFEQSKMAGKLREGIFCVNAVAESKACCKVGYTEYIPITQ